MEGVARPWPVRLREKTMFAWLAAAFRSIAPGFTVGSRKLAGCSLGEASKAASSPGRKHREEKAEPAE